MQTYAGAVKSLQLKIFPINPYYSEILMRYPLQVHCFHGPEGEGVPSMRFGDRLLRFGPDDKQKP